jgi:hypothetical protein
MKHFRLEKSTTASHSALTRFNVFNSRGDIVGSINVEPSEEADLLAHWRSSSPAPARAAAEVTTTGKQAMVRAMVAASGRNRLSRAAVLRGC